MDFIYSCKFNVRNMILIKPWFLAKVLTINVKIVGSNIKISNALKLIEVIFLRCIHLYRWDYSFSIIESHWKFYLYFSIILIKFSLITHKCGLCNDSVYVKGFFLLHKIICYCLWRFFYTLVKWRFSVFHIITLQYWYFFINIIYFSS